MSTQPETVTVIANPTPEDDHFLHASGEARLALIWQRLGRIEAKIGELLSQ